VGACGRALVGSGRSVRAQRPAPDGQRGLSVVELEHARAAAIDVGDGVAIDLVGRFDRVLDGRNGTLVGDYKTSGNLSWRTEPARMLRGQTLQVPVYALLAGASRVELLGVGPAYDPDDERSRPVFEAFVGDLRGGFLETLRTLVELRRRGVFPAAPDRHCGWCAYRTTCRRNHPPTAHRELGRDDARAFRALAHKNTRQPWLPPADAS
jgi:RecB family exonuclease